MVISLERSKVQLMTVLTTMFIILMSSTVFVFAANQGTNSQLASYVAENGDNMKSAVKNYFKTTRNFDDVQGGKYDLKYNYYVYTSEAGTTTYYVIEASKEEAAVNKIEKMSTTTNFSNDLDTDILGGYSFAADTGMATQLLSGFFPILTTVLGIIVVLITTGMTVFSAFDLSYIAFPVIRNTCEEHKMSGGVMAKQGKNGETKLRFVSDDAQYAVAAADTVQSGRNPFVIYFGKRVVSYITLAILIFILLTGNINIFAKLSIKVVQGILDLINGF